MKTQLLCTFAHKKDLDLIADYIATSYDVSERRMFVFADEENKNDLYLTIGTPTSDSKKTSMLAQNEKSIYGKILKINKNNLLEYDNENLEYSIYSKVNFLV